MESFWVVPFLLRQSKLPLAAGGEQTGQAGEEMTHSKGISNTLCRIRNQTHTFRSPALTLLQADFYW